MVTKFKNYVLITASIAFLFFIAKAFFYKNTTQTISLDNSADFVTSSGTFTFPEKTVYDSDLDTETFNTDPEVFDLSHQITKVVLFSDTQKSKTELGHLHSFFSAKHKFFKPAFVHLFSFDKGQKFESQLNGQVTRFKVVKKIINQPSGESIILKIDDNGFGVVTKEADSNSYYGEFFAHGNEYIFLSQGDLGVIDLRKNIIQQKGIKNVH